MADGVIKRHIPPPAFLAVLRISAHIERTTLGAITLLLHRVRHYPHPGVAPGPRIPFARVLVLIEGGRL